MSRRHPPAQIHAIAGGGKYALFLFLIIILVIRLLTYNTPFLDGQKIRISSRVSSEPIKYSYYQVIYVKGLKVYLPTFPEITYGDFVVIEGVVETGELKDPLLIEFKKTEGVLYLVREKLLENFRKALPEPHSSLVAGVTLGIKSAMPKDFWEALKKTGTAHVVVASGMNVTLVSSFLISFLILFFTRKKALVLAIVGIWFYAVLCGFDAPIIRAAIMGSLAFVAQKVGRVSIAWRGLILAVLIMLIINPGWIMDIGFILSFLATASILAFEPKLRKFFSFLPKVVREGLSTALAAQIGVAPVLFITFGSYNILSLIINTLIAPTVAPITIIAGLAGLIGLVIAPLGRILTLLVYPLTSFFIGVVNLFT